jgi:hypothetical protein
MTEPAASPAPTMHSSAVIEMPRLDHVSPPGVAHAFAALVRTFDVVVEELDDLSEDGHIQIRLHGTDPAILADAVSAIIFPANVQEAKK